MVVIGGNMLWKTYGCVGLELWRQGVVDQPDTTIVAGTWKLGPTTGTAPPTNQPITVDVSSPPASPTFDIPIAASLPLSAESYSRCAGGVLRRHGLVVPHPPRGTGRG
ncbi:hypothetical protein Nepgr_003522 [Nepenthes gracilis]|uniref:Uncharacterized protein n=1 Tax=Nepenthes gracilis TaxID=150966 RepID=A0AAD3RZS9_NEPGR|nr:hypothetical protein Nepgr_003522 [Nepenthes gracilis]